MRQLRGANVGEGRTWIHPLAANSHWFGEYLQKIGQTRAKTRILRGAQDGALTHVVEARPFLEMVSAEKSFLEGMNSAGGRAKPLNLTTGREMEFILPYERGAGRWS